MSLVFLAPGLVRAQGTGDIPNPYTVFDVPGDSEDYPLGLDKNDYGEEPAMKTPPKPPAYCAYIFREDQIDKIFSNGQGRAYSVSFRRNGDPESVSYALAILDSMAVYMLDHKDKVITKVPIEETHNFPTTVDFFVPGWEGVTDESISSVAGRWCYSRTTEAHHGNDFGTNTLSWDLETGICLQEAIPRAYTRNIHIGLFYPEIYELPEGYTFKVLDFDKARQQVKTVEDNLKAFQDKWKELNVENMSLEEVLKLQESLRK
ncbi:MAG: hypothetical protein K6E35_05465 [Bacteroidales bacterium]|nr:hypothetical protein [Bacteroidales bacterium]